MWTKRIILFNFTRLNVILPLENQHRGACILACVRSSTTPPQKFYITVLGHTYPSMLSVRESIYIIPVLSSSSICMLDHFTGVEKKCWNNHKMLIPIEQNIKYFFNYVTWSGKNSWRNGPNNMIPNPSGSNLFFMRFILWGGGEKKEKQWIPKEKKLMFLIS